MAPLEPEGAPGPRQHRSPSPKRQRLGEEEVPASGPNGSEYRDKTPPGSAQCPGRILVLTPEQHARIEQNRRLAALRKEQQLCTYDSGSKVKTLTAEQLDRIERNRLAALRRRQADRSALGSGITAEQMELIERKRLEALERRRLQTAMVEGALGAERQDPAPASPAPSSPDLPPLPSFSSSGSSSPSSAPFSPLSSNDSPSSSSESSASDDESLPVPHRAPSSQSSAAGRDEVRTEMESGHESGQSMPTRMSTSSSFEQDGTVTEHRVPTILAHVPAPGTACVPPPKAAKERTPKQALVAQLLCRWWYVLPPWPPEDFNYDAALNARGYRRVPVESFHLEPERDGRGREKVFALKGWLGLFRTGYGDLVDVRPIEGRPSYDRLMLRSVPDLRRLLVAAYENQLKELLSQPCRGPEGDELRQEVRRQAAEARRRAAFALTFAPKTAKVNAGKDL